MARRREEREPLLPNDNDSVQREINRIHSRIDAMEEHKILGGASTIETASSVKTEDEEAPGCCLCKVRKAVSKSKPHRVLRKFCAAESPKPLLVAIFYLLLQVLVSIVLIVNWHTQTTGSLNVTKATVEYLMSGYMVIGLIGILAVFLKENSINFVIFRTNEKQSSKYLMASVYAFGGGSLFMAVVNLFSYAHCREENSHIVFSVFHFAHILSQMLFLQRFSLAIFRRSVGFVFLMFHIFGTNISICILYLTEETQMYKYNPKDEHHDNCKENNGVTQMADTWSKFMAPFSIEFCLICAGMIYSMVNSTKHFPKYANRIQRDILHPKMHESLAPSEAASTYSSLSVMGETEHNARTYWEKQVMLDKVPLYSGAHPGFLAGLTVAVIMTVSGLAVQNTKDVHDSLLFHHIYLSVVSISQIISIAVINRSLKNHEYVPQNFRSDDTLMVISFAGLFAWELMCLISVMNGMKEKSWLSVVIFVHNLVNLITCMVQCRVIIRTLRFRNRIQSHKMHLLWDRDSMVYTMSRLNQSVVYLLMTNIGFWILDSFFEIKHFGELFYPTGIEFYNKSAWDLMSAMLYPLGIFFRFHSVILLFEIWARFGRHARSNACKDAVEGRSRKNSLPPIEFFSEGERAVRKIRNAPSRDYADIYRQHLSR